MSDLPKLVRDRIPEILRAKDVSFSVRTAQPLRRLPLLRAKILEEALELAEANDRESVLEEIADLRTVLRVVGEFWEIGEAEIDAAMFNKDEARGTFNDWVELTWLSDEQTSP